MTTPADHPRICIISPGRDEAAYAPRTIASMVAQTVRPDRWIIVDDGSTDGMSEIVDAAAAEHEWIHVVRRDDRGHRAVGPGVILAFEAGLETVDLDDYDFVGKFDLDLDLPPTYFERLLARMADDPRLGTASGKAWYAGDAGQRISEGISDEMSVGAAKFIRVTCFRELGGFVREVMWDGIDCHHARMLGWRAASLDDAELAFEHLRPMGSSQKGILTGRMRHGFGQWFMGTGLVFMTASAVFRMTRPPRVIGGAAMWWGYVRSMLKGDRRYPDRAFRRFVRAYQWSALFRGKRAAVARIDAETAGSWAARWGTDPAGREAGQSVRPTTA